MEASNGFFGSLQGPFAANQELFLKIQQSCSKPLNYINKIGICYSNNYDLDIEHNQIYVFINNQKFQLGKTGILEYDDVKITSIYFEQDMQENIFINYCYQ